MAIATRRAQRSSSSRMRPLTEPYDGGSRRVCNSAIRQVFLRDGTLEAIGNVLGHTEKAAAELKSDIMLVHVGLTTTLILHTRSGSAAGKLNRRRGPELLEGKATTRREIR